MNSFEVITKYLPQAVDKYFAAESKTAVLEQGSKFIDVNFNEAGYVKIASFLMDGLSDYYKTQGSVAPSNSADYAAYAGNVNAGQRDGFEIGGVSVKWEIFRLQYVRGKQFRIDYIENEETAGITIGNAIEEFNRVKVIPEVDATRFSIIADTTSVSLGNMVSETVAANQIISKFNSAFEWLTENEVPEEEQIIFVSPSVMTLIRNSTELAKFLTQGDYRAASGIDFTVEKYGGRPIIEVPSNRFFTNVLVTNNGYRPQTSSKVINFMVVSAKAVIPIRKLEWNKIYGPELSGIAGFHGYIINYLIYHGVVIPENKITGVYVSVSETNASTKTALLKVSTKAGSVQYGWVMDRYFTNPAGLRGYIVYAYTDEFTLGGAISSVGTLNTDYFVCEKGVEQKAVAANTTGYFALVDDSGKIIAVSSAVTLERHA